MKEDGIISYLKELFSDFNDIDMNVEVGYYNMMYRIHIDITDIYHMARSKPQYIENYSDRSVYIVDGLDYLLIKAEQIMHTYRLDVPYVIGLKYVIDHQINLMYSTDYSRTMAKEY
jgi:hypothetical protein